MLSNFSVKLAASLSVLNDLKESGRRLEDSGASPKQLQQRVSEPRPQHLDSIGVSIDIREQESLVIPLLDHYVIFSRTSQQYK